MDDPLLGAGSGNFDVQAAAEGGKAPIELMSQVEFILFLYEVAVQHSQRMTLIYSF